MVITGLPNWWENDIFSYFLRKFQLFSTNVTKIFQAAKKNRPIPNSMYIVEYENGSQTSETVRAISIFGNFFNTGNTVEILSHELSSAYRD